MITIRNLGSLKNSVHQGRNVYLSSTSKQISIPLIMHVIEMRRSVDSLEG